MLNVCTYVCTLKCCCKTRRAFLCWRRQWEQPRHRREPKARKLSSKDRSSVSRRSLACWSCSQFSSAPLFLSPWSPSFFSLLSLLLLHLPFSLSHRLKISNQKKYIHIHVHTICIYIYIWFINSGVCVFKLKFKPQINNKKWSCILLLFYA